MSSSEDPAARAAARYDPAADYGPAFARAGGSDAELTGGGFSGAGVWRLQTVAGPFALRLWPAAPPPHARLAGLHGLLSHVARRDPAAPIAVPVTAASGGTLVRVGGRLAQLEPWRPGVPLGINPPAGDSAAAAGALAQFHRAAEDYEPTDAAVAYFGRSRGTPPSLAARRDRLRRWLGGAGDRAEAARRAAPAGAFRDLAGDLEPKQGLTSLLSWLDDREIKRALVTSAPSENVDYLLQAASLEGQFPVKVLAERLEHGKPDPQPYEESLERLGVAAENALAFEDSLAGVQSASSAGILTVGIATTQKPEDLKKSGAALVIRDFTDEALWTVLRSEE